MTKINLMILILLSIAVFIIGFLAGSIFTLPAPGGRCLTPSASLIAISPKEPIIINYFAECLELVKNSDSFQKELYDKQWMKKKESK